MSAADILRQAGFVPVVPEASRPTGTPAALTPRCVPVVPPVPVRKHKDEVAAANTNMPTLSPEQVAILESMAVDTATRNAGKVPEADTAAMLCRHCGPVWIHPDIAAVLPVVDGWPRALGCPWCAVRKAGGYIPRPSIACGDCQHFTPDTINPPAGIGTCSSGHGTHYPMKAHRCGDFQPEQGPTP